MVSTKTARAQLADWLSNAEKVVVAGIGNPLRMDDFVGVKIVQDLCGRVTKKVYLIECETTPESFIQQIIEFDPTHVLIIDAAILGLNPGRSKIVNVEQLETFSAFSTHILPIRIFCEYLSQATKAKIALLLLEPKNTDFGEGLTPEIEKTAKHLTNLLLKTLP